MAEQDPASASTRKRTGTFVNEPNSVLPVQLVYKPGISSRVHKPKRVVSE
jgi:hypothetical protein